VIGCIYDDKFKLPLRYRRLRVSNTLLDGEQLIYGVSFRLKTIKGEASRRERR
jgi:hypothetical protein